MASSEPPSSDFMGLEGPSEPCVVCDGTRMVGDQACPACQPQTVPVGSEGWVSCHYLDQFGTPQSMTLLTTEPLHYALQRQEEVRAALEMLCASLGYEVLSVQLVIVGANNIPVSRPLAEAAPGSNILAFPVRQGGPTE